LENIFMGLRLVEGIELAQFRQRFGVDVIACYFDRLAPLVEEGFLEITQTHLRLTRKGLMRADAVVGYLV
ncbi:MAG: coproporphyrinogen III oxidase, partial [Candidatus Sumerlaeaceae bacterium]